MVSDRVNIEKKGFPFVEIAELAQDGKRFRVARPIFTVLSGVSTIVSALRHEEMK
jgi:hypothetical protein